MTNKYFGTDGIRGTVNEGNITGEKFFKFGLASGTYFKNQKKLNKLPSLLKILDFQAILWSLRWFQVWSPEECMYLP